MSESSETELLRYITPKYPLRLEGEADVLPVSKLLFVCQALGFRFPAAYFRVVEHRTPAEHAQKTHLYSDEYKALGLGPRTGAGSTAFEDRTRQVNLAIKTYEARLIEEIQNKPFIEVLWQLIVLSQYQQESLQEVIFSADQVFMLYKQEDPQAGIPAYHKP